MRILIAALPLLCCNFASAFEPEPVPLIRLIANPEKLNGQAVSTSGVAREFGDGKWVLYTDCDSAAAQILANGLGFLDPDKSKNSSKKTDLEMKFVMVLGVFRTNPSTPKGVSGHLEQESVVVYPLLRDSPSEKDMACPSRR